MKRAILFLLAITLISCVSITEVNALYDPLSKKNNKVGIHILFPSELKTAAKLVNSSGGDWGYVTIPIQASDKDLEKWQYFMDDCKRYHLIPIIRLATNGDYFNTKVWEKPSLETVLDFANFLNSLDWPTKNRYVVVFNEVNRGDEWGGVPDPQEYAGLLSYAATVFKSKSSDFFIISAGMDNASSDDYPNAMNKFSFFLAMEKAVPGIFNQIDGFGSHSYPNPGFSQPPSVNSPESIVSFIYEKNYVENFTSNDLPVFITETGWTRRSFSDNQVGEFFTIAFDSVWNKENVVAVTPFLLQAGTEPFMQFSMTNTDGTENDIFKAVTQIKKVQGDPVVSEIKKVLGEQIAKGKDLPVRAFNKKTKSPHFNVNQSVIIFLKWILKID